DQQEGLARQRGDVGEFLLTWQLGLDRAPRAVDGKRIPDFGEQTIERYPGAPLIVHHAWVGDHGLEAGCNIRIARGLASRQGSAIPPQKRHILGDRLGIRHWPSHWPVHVTLSNAAPQKKFQQGSERKSLGSVRP